MGTWMPDITKKPTIAEKIEFGHDASDVHLFWADYVKNHPEYAELMGDEAWHLECAVLHEETALELEEYAKLIGEQKLGCNPFGKLVSKGGKQ